MISDRNKQSEERSLLPNLRKYALAAEVKSERRPFGIRDARLGWLLFLSAICVVATCAAGAGKASAAFRFASPGGSGPSPCVKADPCSLYVAASEEVPIAERAKGGDEIILLPGEYSGMEDLGPEERIALPLNIKVRGEPGQPRPVIRSNSINYVMALNGGNTVSDLEIIAPQGQTPLTMGESVAERLVVRSSAEKALLASFIFSLCSETALASRPVEKELAWGSVRAATFGR